VRVIAGNLRGKRLAGIRGLAIRPTADRLRESLFNILGAGVRDAVVLDLFAGTGALGIEALSRGAAWASFVDRSRKALAVVKKNIESCRLTCKAAVVHCDAVKNLSGVARSVLFDLVFMDPPYQQRLVSPALQTLCCSGLLAPHALVVVEHDVQEPVVRLPEGLSLFDQRKYGKTLVSFFNWV
jgi:16S rRNA (guanine966-N2)-methyltransferase